MTERIYLTASRELPEVLPNMPNPKSSFYDALAGKVVLDHWGWGSRFSDTARYLETLKGYGVDELAIIYHVWQRHGYDNGLPEHVPANPDRGGDEDMRLLGANAKELGYLFSLHENYIDYYPNYPGYTEEAISLDSRGKKIKAWFMPSTGIQSFRLKPTWIDRYVRDQSTQAHRRYHTSAGYLDVQSVGFPFQIDYDARAEGAASSKYTFNKLSWLFDFMRETHGGPLFGEGNWHALWAGRVDGCEAQIGGRGGELVPPLVDFDLLKVQPLAVNHGMGYYSRWHRNRKGHLNDKDLTKYRAREIAYGHAGFLNTPVMSNLTQVLREYYLMQPLQPFYFYSTPVEIKYLFDVPPDGIEQWVSSRVACRSSAPRKVRIRYANKLTLHINDEQGDWEINNRVLPPHGFLAQGLRVKAWTARRDDGMVADFLETMDMIFADPRTYETYYSDPASTTIAETLSPEVEPLGERLFNITYRWKILETPDPKYRIFVHFTDRDGRILWQNDHPPKLPLAQWEPGTDYVDGPFRVRVPDHIMPDVYDIRVGFYEPGGPDRLRLTGHNTGSDSYLIGRLKVGEEPPQLVTLKTPSHGLRPGTNPYGSQVDFGKLKSDFALRLDKREDGLLLMPIPHGHHGTVALQLHQLVPGADLDTVNVIALDSSREAIGSIPFTVDGDAITFETTEANAWFYDIQVQLLTGRKKFQYLKERR